MHGDTQMNIILNRYSSKSCEIGKAPEPEERALCIVQTMIRIVTSKHVL